MDFFHDIFWVLRLGQIEVATDPLAFFIIMVLIERRKKKNHDVLGFRTAFDPFAYVKTGLPAEDNVQDNQVRFFLLDDLHGLIGRNCLGDGKAFQFKKKAEDFTDSRFVIHE